MELKKVKPVEIIPGNVIYALKGDSSMILEARSGSFEIDRVLRSTVSGTDIPMEEILDWDLYLLGHKVRDSSFNTELIPPGNQELSVGDFVVDVWNSDHSRFTGIVVNVDTSNPTGVFAEVVTCYFDYSYSSSGRVVTSDSLAVEFGPIPLDVGVENYKKIVYEGSTFEANEEKIVGKVALQLGPDVVSKLIDALDKVKGRNESN